MKPSNKLVETEKTPGHVKKSGELAIDPFAVDFFGADSSSSGEIPPPPEKVTARKKVGGKKIDWFRFLPRLTNTEAEFSNALQNLPENLTGKSAEIINASIARYTFRQPEKVKCSIISVSETNLTESVNKLAKSPMVFFTLECQPENASALLAVNTTFASSVIDLILGGQGEEYADPRDLSPIENAVVEFLAVNVLSEINKYLGEQPVFCLQTVGKDSAVAFDPNERGAEVVFLIEIENFSGILTALAPRSFLSGLDKTQNPLLEKKSGRKTIEDLELIVPELEMNLQVGTTYLDGDSLSFLEPDDIVLIEKPEITTEKGLLGDNLYLCAGRGRSFRLSGTAETAGFGGEMSFKIREIFSEERRRKFTPITLKMDETDNDLSEETGGQLLPETDEEIFSEESPAEPEEQNSASLENVQVALRVEIAAHKISLRDLKNLRSGQIIALGCRPTDPVRLVTDQTEEPIASGELIEIEGQLGVRLTKVFI